MESIPSVVVLKPFSGHGGRAVLRWVSDRPVPQPADFLLAVTPEQLDEMKHRNFNVDFVGRCTESAADPGDVARLRDEVCGGNPDNFLALLSNRHGRCAIPVLAGYDGSQPIWPRNFRAAAPAA